ncbi:MarR family winged helix-turn-helix transcriptional regulator [Microlunatus soli]|uniref:DNA-binding transcriptional regulator, MarR family n=1 Tax=Microlunatus soli TaxID=630515 RepID=A0A1H2ANW9_9ACTN|nr:MarR family transcriptional regulator [Microlunatus soli]SDT47638.1 DNA-binding transcriptional regulator, MarR family [Microlunatus soli]
MKDPTRAWASLLRVHATLVPQLDQVLLAEHGIPLTWYDVLLELNADPEGRLTMTELGRSAVVSRSRVSRVVDELSRAGLVRRTPNPADRRSSLATITPRGRRKLTEAEPTYVAEIRRRFTGQLTAEQQKAIAVGLERVLAAQQTYPISAPRRSS